MSDLLSSTERAALDNPAWSSLTGLHAPIARRAGGLRWFPRQFAPFLAVAERSSLVDPGLVPALDIGGSYFVGVVPDALPAGMGVESRSEVYQMLLATPVTAPRDIADCVPLGAADAPAMLALATLAFPHFFRSRTRELGAYYGVFAKGELVAMAGERMAFGVWREISGVCTHPQHVGRGYARRLTCALIERHRQQGYQTFLHVSAGNEAAFTLYQRMQFVVRATLSMTQLTHYT